MDKSRMDKGMPDSELPPFRLVLTLRLGVRAAAVASRVLVLPAEPVTPMMVW